MLILARHVMLTLILLSAAAVNAETTTRPSALRYRLHVGDELIYRSLDTARSDSDPRQIKYSSQSRSIFRDIAAQIDPLLAAATSQPSSDR